MEPSAGTPLKTPVVVSNVTPLGSTPASVKVGTGKPLAATVNVFMVSAVIVVLLALVIAGACTTFSVNGWLASDPTLLVALKLRW